jgi:single-strand DNA-binding protein
MNDLIISIIRASQHTFVGRIGRAPEIKFLDGGSSVAKTSLAVNRPGSRRGDHEAQPDWFTIEAWNNLAQQLADTISQGDLVEVTGRVKSNRYTSTTTGEEKTELIVTVQAFKVLSRKNSVPERQAEQVSEEEIPF